MKHEFAMKLITVQFSRYLSDPQVVNLGPFLVILCTIMLLPGKILAPLLFSEVNNLNLIAIIVAVLFFGEFWNALGVFCHRPVKFGARGR